MGEIKDLHRVSEIGSTERMETQTKADVIPAMNIGEGEELEQVLPGSDPEEVLDVAAGHREIPAVQGTNPVEEPKELQSTPRAAQANAIIRHSHSQASNSLTNYSLKKKNYILAICFPAFIPKF